MDGVILNHWVGTSVCHLYTIVSVSTDFVSLDLTLHVPRYLDAVHGVIPDNIAFNHRIGASILRCHAIAVMVNFVPTQYPSCAFPN